MKKRSLLLVSLASLVSLVGCGKDGAAASCKAEDYDNLTFAQYGVFMGNMYQGTLPFEYEAYNYCKVTYEISESASGYYAEYYGLEEDNYKESIKGSFVVVLDDGYEWVVDPEAEYSEDELAEIEYVLYQYCHFGYLSIFSWGYFYSYSEGFGSVLLAEEEYAADIDNFDFKASFTTAPGYSYTDKEIIEEFDGEGEEAVLVSREVTNGKTSAEYNDLYGYMTKYSESYDAKYESFGEEPGKGKASSSASLTFKYKAIIEEDDLR